uniref:Uncharacterized protein n=1 Tax=Anopheles christyi TaxID=43041 RepID=A0A182KIP8_9DIPT
MLFCFIIYLFVVLFY